MLNNEEIKNAEMSIEDRQQMLAFKTILLNLEAEISTANKNLKSIKGDTERAIKEKVYQEELLANTTQQVNDLKIEHSKLVENHSKTSISLASINTEIAQKKSVQEAKEAQLKTREETIVSKEIELSDKESNLTKQKTVLEKNQMEHDSKVAKLKEVTALF